MYEFRHLHFRHSKRRLKWNKLEVKAKPLYWTLCSTQTYLFLSKIISLTRRVKIYSISAALFSSQQKTAQVKISTVTVKTYPKHIIFNRFKFNYVHKKSCLISRDKIYQIRQLSFRHKTDSWAKKKWWQTKIEYLHHDFYQSHTQSM